MSDDLDISVRHPRVFHEPGPMLVRVIINDRRGLAQLVYGDRMGSYATEIGRVSPREARMKIHEANQIGANDAKAQMCLTALGTVQRASGDAYGF